MLFHKGIVNFKIKDLDVIGNLNNGCIIGLDLSGKELSGKLKNGDLSEEELIAADQELFNSLKEGEFFDEITNDNALSSAYIHVTQRCNLNCLGCYSYDDTRNKLHDPALYNIKRAITQLRKNGVKALVITGGEPFLRKDLAEIVKHARVDVGIEQLDIITNGTMVNRNMLAKIKPYVNNIAVSFDGYNREHPSFIRDKGIFDKLLSTVQTIKEAGIRVSILPVIHSKNYTSLNEYVTLAKSIGAEISFSLLTCSPQNKMYQDYIPSDDQLNDLGKALILLEMDDSITFRDMPISTSLAARKSCEVGHKIVSVGADGTVYPCHMLHDKELAMGNIFYESLKDIMTSPIADLCRRLNVNDFDTCGECKHKYLCGGGCRARSYLKYKNLNSHDYYCKMPSTFFDIIGTIVCERYADK